MGSASRGPGAKPIPRSDELFGASPTYRGLVERLGSLPPQGLLLAEVVASLGESTAALLEPLLRGRGAGGVAKDLVAALDLTAQPPAPDAWDDAGAGAGAGATTAAGGSAGQRNPLHAFAAAGSAAPVRTLAAFVASERARARAAESEGSDLADAAEAAEAVDDPKGRKAAKVVTDAAKLAAAVGVALGQRDSRGLTPLDYATLRWGLGGEGRSGSSSGGGDAEDMHGGPRGTVADTLVALAEAAGVEPLGPTVAAPGPAANGARRQPVAVAAAAIAATRGGGDPFGGWDATPWAPLAADAAASGFEERCDVLELRWADVVAAASAEAAGSGASGEAAAHAAFAKRFLREHVARGAPFILRGALPFDPASSPASSLRSRFAKAPFVERYGAHVVPVAAIPYSDSFGTRSQPRTLADVAGVNSTTLAASSLSSSSSSSLALEGLEGVQGAALSSPLSAATVDYAFATPGNGPGNNWAAKVAADAPPPSWLAATLALFPLSGFETQFYLGPGGSGAPTHFHGHAVNLLFHGAKRWTLHPPRAAPYAKEPAAQRHARQSSSSSTGGGDGEATELQCVQHAGDILYVPTLWGHGTINEQQSIGVAFELSLEGFCME